MSTAVEANLWPTPMPGHSPPPFDLNRFPEELREKIMDSCDMATMTALASTSKYWDHKRSKCVHLRIISLLRHFQLEPRPFLEFLTRTSSVVSGSAALLVFFPGLFLPGDLDIYVPHRDLDQALDYLNKFTKYSLEEPSPPKETDPYEAWKFGDNHIAKVLKLYCPPPTGSGIVDPLAINIITVKRIHAVQAISHFHSTEVMNIITGKGVLCMYPSLTLRMRGIINTERHLINAGTETKFARCLEKYRERGFDLAHTLGKWSGLKSIILKKAALRDVPACVVAFPEASKKEEKVKRVPKEKVLKDWEWGLEWEMSAWRYRE